MRTVDLTLSCPVNHSFRVDQVAGMFDVELEDKLTRSWSVKVPDLKDDWGIGAIVGPSGSGKSVIAREVYGDALVERYEWPSDRSVLDAFDDGISARDVTGMLSSVGFSSPPDWIKPYQALSNGQRFRCDLARALLTPRKVMAFDEFTSVVDRQVAKFGSAAVAKTIRAGRTEKGAQRFVAVTCHYDVLDWLQPDWVLDMASGLLARGWVQQERARYDKLVKGRPPIVVRVSRCHYSLWRLFKDHHYLTGNISKASRCYVGTWRDRPVAFCAALPMVGRKDWWRLSRTVVLPDYQGMGIGSRMSEQVADIFAARGSRVTAVASHPALVAHRDRSPLWKLNKVVKGGAPATGMLKGFSTSCGRTVVSFDYVGSASRAKRRAKAKR